MSKQVIDEAFVIEGALYPVADEDGQGISFDCLVGVRLPDGREFAHRSFYAKGKDRHPDGYEVVCRSRAEAQAFADRVAARGVVDLRYWEVLPEGPGLEERLAGYAIEEAYERNGRL